MTTEPVKLTIQQILDYDASLKSIIDNVKDVNALVKFKLLGMCKQFEPIVSDFTTIRNEKIMKYGTPTEDGYAVVPPDKSKFESDEEYAAAESAYEDRFKSFETEMSELLGSEVDVVVTKFKSEDILNAGLPADYLLHIYDLIEE